MTPERQIAELRRRQSKSVSRSGTTDWLPLTDNAMEFVTGKDYLGERLYPRQAVVFKLAVGMGLLTSYDYGVIAKWGAARSEGFDDGVPLWQGTKGIAADFLERRDVLAARGWAGPTEVVLAAGRRGGKSFIGSLVAAWRIARFLALEDPHDYYGIQADKPVAVLVFSGSRDRASRDQFGDLRRVLTRSPWLQQYLVSDTSTRVEFATRRAILDARGGRPAVALRAEAVETTEMSARGPATLIALLDEAAHLRGQGSTSTAEQIYDAVRPAVAQFRGDGLIWMASSPSSMTGIFYRQFLAGMTRNPTKVDEPPWPNVFAAQLDTFEFYRDWNLAKDLQMWKGGPCFEPFKRALFEWDDEARAYEAQNGRKFATEVRSQWETSQDAYLRPDVVRAMFAPSTFCSAINGAPYDPRFEYFAHGDPSNSNCNFGFAIGHSIVVDGVSHAAIDYLHAWRPDQFKDGLINYRTVVDDIAALAVRYHIRRVTFDQFNTAGFKPDLEDKLRAAGAKTTVAIATATAPRNLAMYENLKSMAGEHRVHLPEFRLAHDELMFLEWTGTRVDHPKSGPVQTRDVADSIANLVHTLFDDPHHDEQVFAQLRRSMMRGVGPPGGIGRAW